MVALASWAYDEDSILYYLLDSGILAKIKSSQGVRQGDTLGNLLFSIAYREVLEDAERKLNAGISTASPLLTSWHIFDDTKIYCFTSRIEEVKKIFLAHRHRGIILNVSPNKTCEKELKPETEIKILGGYIGPLPEQFLLAKIEEEAQHILRLDSIEAHHAVILLRISLQHRLRHLLRSLPSSEGLRAIWAEMDKHIRKAVLKLRGQEQHEHEHDARLISLPISYGGCGFLSFEDCATHARAAMIEKMDFLINEFCPDPDYIENDKFKSQRERCHEMHKINRVSLMSSLSSTQLIQYVDNHAFLASQWLSAIPYNNFNTLSKQEIAVGLSHRTLCRGHNIVCKYCCKENVLGHDEVCTQRQNLRTYRHDKVKHQIKYHVEQIEGTTVKVEQQVQNQNKRKDRTDLTISGPGSFRQDTSEFDVSITSVFCQSFPQVPVSETEDLFAMVQEKIQFHLSTKEVLKNRHYSSMTKNAFHPFILSSAGTPATNTKEILNHWRELMEPQVYAALSMSISINLLRAVSFSK